MYIFVWTELISLRYQVNSTTSKRIFDIKQFSHLSQFTPRFHCSYTFHYLSQLFNYLSNNSNEWCVLPAYLLYIYVLASLIHQLTSYNSLSLNNSTHANCTSIFTMAQVLEFLDKHTSFIWCNHSLCPNSLPCRYLFTVPSAF